MKNTDTTSCCVLRRAVDNQVYVATASPARDESASYVAWGHSTVVNPWYSKQQEGEFSPKSKMYTFPPNVSAV